MSKNLLKNIAAHCDKILRTRAIGDYDGAANGLQVENSGTVTKIAAAVDGEKLRAGKIFDRKQPSRL